VGPVKGSVLALTLVMLAFSVAFSISGQQNDVKVDPEVLEQIAEKGEADVIIVLKDDYSGIKGFSASSAGKDSLKSKKEMIRRQQDRVLGGLNEEKPQDNRDFRIESFTEYDIKLKSKFGLVNGLSGKITASGLEKLLDDGSVKEIYPTREIRASLSDSINIVNASMTWNLIYNNSNITGKGEVICIIDTGVDYTHASMGGCTSTSNINDGSCRKVIGGYDFVNSDQNPIDDHGHGTHVAGIVASTHSTYTGIARDANIIAITAGGQLHKEASKTIRIPSGLQPRAAIGYLFFPMLGVLYNSNLIDVKNADLNEMLVLLSQNQGIKETAEQLAKKIQGKIPIIYSSELLKPVAYRWQTQINENAKYPAYHSSFSEMNHNEINAFRNMERKKFIPILIRDEKDHPRIKRRMDVCKQIMERNVDVEEVHIKGSSLLARMFYTIYLGDYTSYYLALRERVDPTPVEVIEWLKKQLG